MASAKMDGHVLLPKQLWDKESKELRNAIYDDWKRKAIDSAKKRAAAQNVDYPTFANLVVVAHLKPVERKMPREGDENHLKHFYKGMAPAWSFDSSGTVKPCRIEDRNENGLSALLEFQKLRCDDPSLLAKITNDVFLKHWRQLNKDVFLQMKFLTSLDPANFAKIFKAELPPNLLADILTIICTCFRAKENTHNDPERQKLFHAACIREVDENWTIQMLEAMTTCGRFSLAIGFVGENTRAMVRALLSHLANSDWCNNVKKGDSLSSPISRIQKIIALYRLQVDR